MLETRAREEIDFRVGFGAAGSAARGHPADAKTARFRITFLHNNKRKRFSFQHDSIGGGAGGGGGVYAHLRNQ